MRAVIDANVIVSAALVRDSPPDRVLRAYRRGEFEVVTSAALLAELETVLSRDRIRIRLGWSQSEIGSFIRDLANDAVMAVPRHQLDVATDEADNRVIEAAVEAQADYIVTGDKRLLALGEYEGIPIITPARFVAILTAAANF